MAFRLRDLSVLAYANGFTFWHYKSSTDKVAGILNEGYFSSACDLLAARDVVTFSGIDGGGTGLVTSPGKRIILAHLMGDRHPTFIPEPNPPNDNLAPSPEVMSQLMNAFFDADGGNENGVRAVAILTRAIYAKDPAP